MKYLIVDEYSKIILVYTEDSRIASNLKRAIRDVEISVLFSHYPYYKNIDDRFLNETNVSINDEKHIDVIQNENCPSYIKDKKDLSLHKRKLINLLFKMAERTMCSYTFFINDSICNFLDDEKNKILYQESREFNKENCLIDLDLRKSTYTTIMIKLQACIDDFLDMIILNNDKEQLSDIEYKIKERLL